MLVRPSLIGWRVKVFAGFALIAALGAHVLLDVPAGWSAPPRVLAQILAVIGGLLTIWHYQYLVEPNRGGECTRLVTRGGLFPCVRHPMYLGDSLLFIGLCLLFPHPLTVVFAVVGVVALVMQCKAEDAYLAQRFPVEYPAWRARSGMLLPHLRRDTGV